MKITYDKQPCRHCGNPVILREKPNKQPKNGQEYCFTRTFYCPICKAIYLDESSKRYKNLEENKLILDK